MEPEIPRSAEADRDLETILLQQLIADAQHCLGEARAVELRDAIEAMVPMLARLGRVPLGADDVEPDFIR